VTAPTPGKLYRHWKGDLYRCLEIATHTETKETFVVYRSERTGITWCRPLDLWNKPARIPGDLNFREDPRFTEVES